MAICWLILWRIRFMAGRLPFSEGGANRLKGPNYETEWLHSHEALRVFIADRVEQDALDALIPDFCETLKRLTYDPNQDYAHTAASVVTHLPVVTAQLHKQLSDIRRENQSDWKESGQDTRLEDFKAASGVETIKGKPE